jgi:hypothetical protein
MRTIPLTKGKKALVDDCDYDYLMQWKWHAAVGGQYAARRQRAECRAMVWMHRVVADRSGLECGNLTIDHVDGNTRNNCRSNLRVATAAQNSANQRRRRDSASGFKGVSWHKQLKKWRAYIGLQRRHQHLGLFEDPHDAARAYNEAALKNFGEFACLNPV